MKIINNSLFQLTVPTPFAVGDVHLYLLKGDSLTLIDAGVKTKKAFEAIQVQLKEIGYHPRDIEQIILTHHHPDHTGLVEAFPRAKEIMGNGLVDLWLRKDEQYFKRYEDFFKDYFRRCDIPPHFKGIGKKLRSLMHYAGEGNLTSFLDEGDRLPGHQNWQVINTKGHAQSHISFYNETEKLFIGGDHLMKNISSNPVIEAPVLEGEQRASPLLQYRDSLRRCESLEISHLLPGHGEIFTNVSEVVQARFDKQEKRAAHVFELLQSGKHTAFQLCQSIFPTRYETQIDLTLSEVVGQLDYLQARGMIRKSAEGEMDFYETATAGE
ncbi:MBL fold metallo-hydrolase [Oceanobacillus manasiensis]|uniref:MBL fold metallo-hydrolase n=1 Tax=Oceanobacillus manasiensis TaxID=586413 RepID=UPI0005AA0F78|nr:MBL fold metallo-hydrolase [Oceanobacillus manasiensis]